MHALLLILSILFTITSSLKAVEPQANGFSQTIDDFSRCNATVIKAFITPTSYEELSVILKKAKKDGTKISVAGVRHSQGGHAFYPNGVVINLQNLNKILDLDLKRNTITVQAGVTWKEVQEYLNPHNKAVLIMQFANVFTIGGALSVNCNGIDPHHSIFIESVLSIKIMNAEGNILTASRTENPELFKLAIGGYGLFGIILEATIAITENKLYRRSSQRMSLEEYVQFAPTVRDDHNLGFHFATLALKPRRKKLFHEVTAIQYRTIDEKKLSKKAYARHNKLRKEKHIGIKKAGISFLRKSATVKAHQVAPDWAADHDIRSRNNIMSPPVSHVYYESSKETDLLQEYFIPPHKLVEFITVLETATRKFKINLMHVALRFIPKNNESFLSYVRQDSIGIVILFCQKLTPECCQKSAEWSAALIESARAAGGTYYLPIQLQASNEQIREIYPLLDDFFKRKKQYDPEERFMNCFYQKYAAPQK